MFQSPAEALISSAVLRRGASLLLHVIRAEGGRALFGDMVDEAVAQLRSGEEDLDAILRAGEPWNATGVSRAEAAEALEEALRLLDIGNSCEEVVELTSHSVLDFCGVMRGESVRLSLERRDARSAWGLYSPFAVVAGPPGLLGKRVVEVDCKNESDAPADDPFFGIKAGDRLYFADPDRAAVKEIALHDHLPEMSRWLAPLLEIMYKVERGEAAGLSVVVDGKPTAFEDLFLEDELQEAIAFSMLTKQMNGEDERVRARMERLADFPAVRELQRLVTSDADWQEVAEVLRPKSQAVYEAARTASLRTRSLTPDEDRVVVYGVRASEIALAVAAILAGLALAACAPKLAELRDTWGAEKSLPLYGLQDGEAPRTAPLLYGTPLMPLS